MLTLRERIRYNRLSRIHDNGESRLGAWFRALLDELVVNRA